MNNICTTIKIKKHKHPYVSQAGYKIEDSTEKPGNFCWWHYETATESDPFKTQELAIKSAESVIAENSSRILRISIERWKSYAVSTKKSKLTLLRK